MKKMLLMAVMTAMVVSVQAMAFGEARSEALYLSDKMAYELGLSMSQYDAVYEINFDYFYSVNRRSEVNGKYWRRRNSDMRYVLSTYQYSRYQATTYFYHPLGWSGSGFVFNVYTRYYDHNRLFYERPSIFDTYRGGHNGSKGSYYSGRTYDNGRRPGNASTTGGSWNGQPGGNGWSVERNGNSLGGDSHRTGGAGNNNGGGNKGAGNINDSNQNVNKGNRSSRSGNGGLAGGVKLGAGGSVNSGNQNSGDRKSNVDANKSNNAGTFGGRRK